jgi:hypothetical protein
MIEIKGPVKESKIKPRWWDLWLNYLVRLLQILMALDMAL